MSSLFDIDKAILEFEYEIDEETGEILNAEDLDNLQMERKTKIEGVGLWVKSLEAEQDAVSNEAKKMAERAKKLGRKIESLKGYLSYALNGEAFDTPKVVMSFRKSTSVSIADDSKIADEWCNVKTVRTPDKNKIKAALKNGEEIEGAKLVVDNKIQVK